MFACSTDYRVAGMSLFPGFATFCRALKKIYSPPPSTKNQTSVPVPAAAKMLPPDHTVIQLSSVTKRVFSSRRFLLTTLTLSPARTPFAFTAHIFY